MRGRHGVTFRLARSRASRHGVTASCRAPTDQGFGVLAFGWSRSSGVRHVLRSRMGYVTAHVWLASSLVGRAVGCRCRVVVVACCWFERRLSSRALASGVGRWRVVTFYMFGRALSSVLSFVVWLFVGFRRARRACWRTGASGVTTALSSGAFGCVGVGYVALLRFHGRGASGVVTLRRRRASYVVVQGVGLRSSFRRALSRASGGVMLRSLLLSVGTGVVTTAFVERHGRRAGTVVVVVRYGCSVQFMFYDSGRVRFVR